MKNLILLFVIIFTGNAFSQLPDTELTDNINMLNSDALYNRHIDDEALQSTLNYLKLQYDEIALEPMEEGLTNEFKLKSSVEVGDNSVSFDVIVPRRGIPMDRIKPLTQNWDQTDDWLPLGFTASGSIKDAELAFVGYGVTADGYDDYAEVDVTDKVAIVLSDVPTPRENYSEMESYRYKAENAKKHGAKAVLFIKPMGDSANVFEPIMVDKYDSGIIALQANRTTLERYFPKKKPLIDQEKLMRNEGIVRSFVLPRVKANISLSLEQKEKSYTNITGFVEGDDEDINIIVAFPYDESLANDKILEYVKKEGKFFYESGNNISGIATALELARRFKENPAGANISFVALSGDEPYLDGSKVFTENYSDLVSTSKAILYLDNTHKVHKNHIMIYTNEPLLNESLSNTEEFKSFNVKAYQLDENDNNPYKDLNRNYVRIANKKRNYPPARRDWMESDYNDLVQYIDMLENAIRELAQ